MSTEPRWDREDVQRVLYHVVKLYQQANTPSNGQGGKTPRRFVFFGRRLPGLGGDSELLRSAIYDVAIPTLKANEWWPEDD
jgi:hypothetical protein